MTDQEPWRRRSCWREVGGMRCDLRAGHDGPCDAPRHGTVAWTLQRAARLDEVRGQVAALLDELSDLERTLSPPRYGPAGRDFPEARHITDLRTALERYAAGTREGQP